MSPYITLLFLDCPFDKENYIDIMIYLISYLTMPVVALSTLLVLSCLLK